jgi:inward rectifier potassium channel
MEKQSPDPGLGEKYSGTIKRLINKDGSFNVNRRGTTFNFRDIYFNLINLSWPRFFIITASVYIFINFLFALSYLAAGVEHLAGKNTNEMNDFLDAFFFSAQTLTTVGYGGISPLGFVVSIISSFEAMTGVLGFAVITGLLYGRFSKPSSKIIFSGSAIITPYKDGYALMFRLANQRRNNLMEIEAKVLVSFLDRTTNSYNRKYYDCRLERAEVYFLPLSWTVVHIIDEDSPLWLKPYEKLKELDAEILILIKGFDDTFSQVVHSRYSYKFDEIKWNVKFKKSFNPDQKGEIIFNLNDLHETESL